MSDVDALRDRLIAERLTARTAEILAAVARVEYYNRQYNAGARTVDALTCPPALAALTPADLAARLPECPESAGAEAIGRDEALGFLAGDVAGYVTGGRAPGPSLGMDMPALFAIAAPGRGAGAAKVEHCVRYVHRRWLAYHAGALRMESTDDNLLRWTAPPVGGWPAVAHPLAPLVDAWQLWKKANDTTAPPDAKTRTAGGLIRLPYAATETVRRAWRPAAEVAAVEVDGEPLTARLLDARPDCAQDWLYVDGPDAGLDERGNLSLPDPSFSPYRQRARDMPITMVALRTLGAMDGRSALRGDVRTVLTVAYAATRPVVWSDDEGARLLARTGTGGYRRPEASDVRRWRDATDATDSIRLYFHDQYGRAWIRVAVADPFIDGRRKISPPAWFREQAGDPENVGAGMGYTLTAAAHPARLHGQKPGPWQHVLANMEYWLARSFDGADGVAPLLVPVRPGGPGPWVAMRWHEVLTLLALDRFDAQSRSGRDAALRRYWRIFTSFHKAGYMKHGEAGPGDVVEIKASARQRGEGRQGKGRAQTPWLRFRATARFCEAARLADDGKWRSAGLLDWFGVPQTHDEPSANAR